MQLDLDYTDPEVSGNWFESLFWESLAGTIWWRSHKLNTVVGRIGVRAAYILVPFGISDLVESQTGAWWRPWWLLAWKAAGVIALAACGYALWKAGKLANQQPEEAPLV